MNLAAPIDLKTWFRTHVEDFLVLTPTSTTPQPVHVLNGFLHHSLSGRRAYKAAADFVAMRPSGGWAASNQDLRQKSPLTLPRDDIRLDSARRAVRSLVATDRAVFANGFASFQLAYPGLITSDASHFRIGELVARLVFRDSRGPELIEHLIDRLKEPQPNPHWAIEHVLSEPGVLDDVVVEAPAPIAWWADRPECDQLTQSLVDLMRRAMLLSVNARDSLIGLEILAVTATWVGLIVYAQVPSLMERHTFSDLLCEAGEPGSLPSVRTASNEAVINLDTQFQEFLFQQLVEEVRVIFGDVLPSDPDLIQFLAETDFKALKLSSGSVLNEAELGEIYSAWRADQTPQVALARALQEGITSAMGNKARDWFAAVGRHCGFVGPRRGHTVRLRSEVPLIPTLVLAGIDEGDDLFIPYDVWSRRLAERFGVFFGPHAARAQAALQASDEDLSINETNLQGLLASLGVARRYSDGVTEVMNPLIAWVNK